MSILTLLLSTPANLHAAEKINLLPPSAYDRSAIYLDLALFWFAIIVLIVLIRLKLREAERLQKMDSHLDDEKIPMLE
jgi:hypothetical protein